MGTGASARVSASSLGPKQALSGVGEDADSKTPLHLYSCHLSLASNPVQLLVSLLVDLAYGETLRPWGKT